MPDLPSTPATSPKIPDLLVNPAVQKHLDIQQSIVNRLAQNSVTCKNWCITLAAGVLVIAFSKDAQDAARKLAPLIACFPIVIFWLLDAFYHALERAFRRQSTEMVRSIHEGTFSPDTLLVITAGRTRWMAFKQTLLVAFSTAATTGFYAAMLVAVGVVRWLLF